MTQDDYDQLRRSNEISAARSDARSECILDMRRYLADGLRKLGIEADDKISLTEVLAIIEGQQADNTRLTTDLDTARRQRETMQTTITHQADEIHRLNHEIGNARQALLLAVDINREAGEGE